MKKLMMLAAFFLVTLSMHAQDNGTMHKKEMKGDHKMMKDCVMMKDGKMMVMKGGKEMMMDHDMTMSNGTMVMADGSAKMKGGKTMMMKDGDCMMMNGKMTHMGMKKKM